MGPLLVMFACSHPVVEILADWEEKLEKITFPSNDLVMISWNSDQSDFCLTINSLIHDCKPNPLQISQHQNMELFTLQLSCLDYNIAQIDWMEKLSVIVSWVRREEGSCLSGCLLLIIELSVRSLHSLSCHCWKLGVGTDIISLYGKPFSNEFWPN